MDPRLDGIHKVLQNVDSELVRLRTENTKLKKEVGAYRSENDEWTIAHRKLKTKIDSLWSGN